MSPTLTAKQRRIVLREKITMYTYAEISEMCGVSERTILRDVKQWQKSGGYDEFLLREFFTLYGVIKRENPRYAFDRICDLIKHNKRIHELPQEDEDTPKYQIEWVGKPDKTNYHTSSEV